MLLPIVARQLVHVSTVLQIQSPGFRVWRFAAVTRTMVEQGGFMKMFLAISALVLTSSCLASAQSTEPQSRDNNAAHYDEPRRNFGWLGLLGPVGLVGFKVLTRQRRNDETGNFPKGSYAHE